MNPPFSLVGPRRPDVRPPGPPGWPLLGHLVQYVRDPFGFETRNRAYGRVTYTEMFDWPFYQLNDPDDVEYVLVHNNENYVKGRVFQRILGPVTGQGLLNSEDEAWRRNRHRIQPAFHPDRIAGYGGMMTAATERAMAGWRPGAVRNVHADTMQLTLEIVARTLLGADVRGDVATVSEALGEVMEASDNVGTDLLPEWVPLPRRRRIARAVERLDAVVYRIVDERRRNPGDDVVSWLLDAETGDGEGMSREQVRDEVMTLLLAGHETTALALTFTLWLLAQHPTVERALLDELARLDGPPTVDDLDDLPYLERVVKESLRLYPPVHGIVREPVADDEVGGYVVPAGAAVVMNQWTIHRDPRFYEDPLAFRPERWTDEFERSLPRFAYFPFGGGPRRCIGDRFAMLEARLVLATLLRRYHFELVSPATLDLAATITTRPRDPILMRLHARDADSADDQPGADAAEVTDAAGTRRRYRGRGPGAPGLK